MPYLAPEAAIPMTSWAPRLAERKASPAIQAGVAGEKDRPGNPGGEGTAREEEIFAAPDRPAEEPADPEHEPEVDDQNGVIDGAELNLGHGRLYGDVVAGDAVRGVVAVATSPRILTASWSCSEAR